MPTLEQRLAAYLKQEIAPLELARLLDQHLYEVVQLTAQCDGVIGREQAATHHHLRRLRDMLMEEVQQQSRV